MRIYLYSQHNFKAKHRGFAAWIPVKLFEFLPLEPFKTSSVFLKSFITNSVWAVHWDISVPTRKQWTFKNYLYPSKNESLAQAAARGSLFDATAGTLSCGAEYTRKGEKYFLLKAWVWGEVIGGRLHRLSKEAVNPCRPMPKCCNFAQKAESYLFFLFPILLEQS